MKKKLKKRSVFLLQLKKLLRMIRITSIFLLLGIIHTYANSYSQETKLNFNVNNATISSVLNRIEEQTEFRFFYDNANIDVSKKISLSIENKDIVDVLNVLFNETQITYEIVDRRILLIPIKPMENFVQVKQGMITGKVVDESGAPIPGTSIQKKGTNDGTISDVDGNFVIPNVSRGDVLVFTFVGMKSQEVVIGTKLELTVVMMAETIGIDEVVAIGYGTTTRGKMVSAVTTVNVDNFKEAPYPNIQSALAGRVAGVFVSTSGGEPGTTPSLTIRGGEPLISQTSPLYVIDGLIKNRDAYTALNPNDIADMSFLKDAAATAVYGAQASAGIVLVTTKQGTVGKPRFNYSNNFAWNTPNLFPELINSYNKAVIANAIGSAAGNGKYTAYTAEQLEIIRNNSDPETYPNTNWYDLTFKKFALQQNHSLSVTGGSNQLKYYVGLGYFDQGSNYVNNAVNYKRFSYRTNITSTYDKIGLDVIFGLNGYFTYKNSPPFSSEGIFSHVVARSPLERAYNPDGTIAGVIDSPIAEIYSPGYSRNQELFTDGTLSFVWKVPWIKGLKFTALGNFNMTNNPSKTFTARATQYNSNGTIYQIAPPTMNQSAGNSSSYNVEFHANYQRIFGKNDVEATFVSNTRGGQSNSLSAYRGDFPSTAVDQLFAGSASTQTNSGSESKWGNVGYVGRLRYIYSSKYLIELSGRYDGSDYFPPGKRFGFFPSIGLGWTASQEKFYQNLGMNNVINYLKIRGSRGTTGSIGGSKYAYIPQYSVNSQVFVADGKLSNGYSEGALTIANQNITWYATHSYNVGIDFTTLNNHLSGTFDYFYTTSKNILSSASYSYIEPLGKSLPQVLSDQKTRKEGVDGSLTYRNKINDFSYEVGFNFSFYNYLWEKSSEDSVALSNPYTRRQGVAQDFYDSRLLHNGLYNSYFDIMNNPIRQTSTALSLGDVWLLDTNGDGIINTQDNRRVGHPSSARFIYGVTFGFKYKGFSLSGLVQGTGPRNTALGGIAQGGDGATRINFDFQMDYWTPNNPDASFPRPGNTSMNSSNNYQSSTFWLISTQYVRLKNLTLNYDLKSIKTSPLFATFNELSVFVSGTNLLTFSPCKRYFDPELANTNNFFYPVNKTYSVGLRLGF